MYIGDPQTLPNYRENMERCDYPDYQVKAEDVNLFTDIFHNYTDEEKEKVVGGFTPRTERTEIAGGGRLSDVAYAEYLQYRNDVESRRNDVESREKIAVIFCILAWAFGWLVIIPYTSWRLYQMGWPFIG